MSKSETNGEIAFLNEKPNSKHLDCDVTVIGAGSYGRAAAARSFGPLLYFVAGTESSSKELASYVGRNRTTKQ